MNNFLKNTLKLFSGNFIAQFFGVISIPIISRLFEIDEFGSYSIILSSSIVLSSFLTLGFHLAILIPKLESEAESLTRLAFICSLSLFSVSCIVIILYADLISTFFPLNNNWLLYSIPVLAFVQSSYLITSYYCARKKQYGLIASGKVAESVTDRGGSIAAGIMGFANSTSLIVFKMLGSVVTIVMWTKEIKPLFVFRKFKPGYYKGLFIKYRNFVLFNTPSIILVNTILQLPLVMFGMFYSPYYAGLFAMANRIVGIPVQTLGGALSKTVTQHIAEIWAQGDKDRARIELERLLTSFTALMMLPFFYLAVAAKPIMIIILGERWADSGVIVQVLALLAFSTLIVQAFGGVFDVTGKQKVRFYFHIFNFLARLGGLWVCYQLGYNFFHAVFVYVLIGLITNFIAIYLIFLCADAHLVIKKSLLKNLVPLLLSIVGYLLIRMFLDGFGLAVMTLFLFLSFYLYYSLPVLKRMYFIETIGDK